MDNCSAIREVELFATAGGPDVDAELLFTWTVPAGRIRGEGQKVIWDLSGVAEGTYTASVEVNDGTGLTAIATTNVTLALCRSCVTRESPCPTITVSCPEHATSNESMTFQAHVYGGDPTVKVTYTWSVSAGKISARQGTSMITVDVSEVTRGSITATVSVGAHDPACVNSATCTTRAAGGGCEVGMRGFLRSIIALLVFATGTGGRKSEQLPQGWAVYLLRNLIIFDNEVREFYCRSAKANDLMVMFDFPRPESHFDDIKKAFISACEDAGIEGLVWHDLRATYGTRLGEAGFNAYDIAKLMGHANISTSERYIRNLPVGAGEAVMLKNQRRHSSTGPTLSQRVRAL